MEICCTYSPAWASLSFWVRKKRRGEKKKNKNTQQGAWTTLPSERREGWGRSGCSTLQMKARSAAANMHVRRAMRSLKTEERCVNGLRECSRSVRSAEGLLEVKQSEASLHGCSSPQPCAAPATPPFPGEVQGRWRVGFKQQGVRDWESGIQCAKQGLWRKRGPRELRT